MKRTHATVLVSLAAGFLVVYPAAAAAAEAIGTQSFGSVELLGGTQVGPGSGLGSVNESFHDELQVFVRPDLEAIVEAAGGDTSPKGLAPLQVPTVKNNKVSLINQRFSGFDGLNHADQRLAGTGVYTNTQFSLEPPDQGLCVGNGFVVETINTAVAVYLEDGTLVAGPTALNQFFGLAPEVIRSTPPSFGDFTSDPRCYFDARTNRFFLTLLQLDVDPPTGNFTGPTHLLFAVTRSGDPTDGWNLFRLTTTADGDNCPCFGDQPLLGADANGFYLSTNAFSLVTGGFVGGQIYAMSKLFLAAGLIPPFVLHIKLPGALNPDGSRNASVHPAARAPDDEFSQFGTEYFLSAFSNQVVLESQVQAWSLRETFLLHFPPGPSTTFTFERQLADSEVYGVPPDALQRIGTLLFPSISGDPQDQGVNPVLATNDQRMQQVTFADGRLWSAVTTVLRSDEDTVPAGAFEDPNKSGVAWFAVSVRSRPHLQAFVDGQGYLALKNANLHFPAVGVNSRNEVAIGFSISGPGIFPTTGYVESKAHKLTEGHKSKSFGKIHIAGVGVGSEDGFTGYPSSYAPGDAPCDFSLTPVQCEARWGDYGAAAIGRDGSIWLANEYIGPRPRTLLANWGTFVMRLGPRGEHEHDDDDD